MASIQSQVDTVKAAVGSPSTCTAATVATLKKLLLPESSESPSTTKSTSRAPKTPSKAKAKASATALSPPELLGSKERAALATHVINVTIKALADAAKPQSPHTSPKRQQTGGGDAPRPGQRTLRRSISTPLSPLQSRTLNRVASSPSVAQKSSAKNTSSASAQATKCLATAECARVALAFLRSVKGPIMADQTDFQIETGMVTLATKLLAIGLNEQALKELRLLKRRLEKGSESGTADAEQVDNAKIASSISELFDYAGLVSKNSLAIVATCQIQSLKLIAASKKPAQIEAIIPFLRDEYVYSPSNILGGLGKMGGGNISKAARQLSSLSQTLLSMAPSVSSSEDNVAMEPRLSPSPLVAFELQVLAFKAQLAWWKLAGHEGKVDSDVVAPFSRCIRCFIRRQPPNDIATYNFAESSCAQIDGLIKAQNYHPTESLTSPKASIYQTLGSAAFTARNFEKAQHWYSILKGYAGKDDDGSVRACSISARLLAAVLKRTQFTPEDEALVEEVIKGLNASLSGTSTEVNELLESLSLVRRSVVGLLMSNWGDKSTITPTLTALLKRFLLRYPRFVLRWLGTPPGKEAPTKQILQFDQRRQVILASVSQVLDGTLTIVKSEIGSPSMDWQTLDDVLHDSTTLMCNIDDSTLPASKSELLGGYFIKISTLYFTIFSQLRRKWDHDKTSKKHALAALKRSIDTVKDRSSLEKEKAQLSTKLELLADLCKGAGRGEDATSMLRSICTNMVEDGVLSKIVAALKTKPPRMAWTGSEKASTLSRTLRSIAKLDESWNDWTFFLPEAERAAVLEHLLHVSAEEGSTNKPLRLHDVGMAALLRIYTTDRYPVRRLRVLLKLFSQQLGRREAMAEVATLLDQALRHTQKKDLSEDNQLTHFLPHLRNYYSSVTSLAAADDVFPTSKIEDAIKAWAAMFDGCKSELDILAKVDEPEVLLDHLLSSNELAGLKGETRLQLSILELGLKLAKIHTTANSDDLISYHCKLANQYINIGLYTEASRTLQDVKTLVQQIGDAAPSVMANFYLSQAQYLSGIEDTKEAMDCLSKANSLNSASTSRSQVQTTLVVSQASLMQSSILLRNGDIQGALRSARSSVKWLSHDWNKQDGPSLQASARPEPTLAESVLGARAPKLKSDDVLGPRLWVLARPLFDSLMHISSLYAHIGMYQETLYYCETAIRVAEGAQSPLLQAEASSWAASIYVKANLPEKALEKLGEVEAAMPREPCAARVKLAQQLGETYRDLGDDEKSATYSTIAEETTRLMGREGVSLSASPAEQPAATASRTKTTVRRAAATKAHAVKAPVARTRARAPTVRSKAVVPAESPSVPTDPYQGSLLASVILSRAFGAANQRDWNAVAAALELIQGLPKMAECLRLEQVITASKHIGLSAEQMIKDPVYSVMHESTISFPAIMANAEKRMSITKSPPRKGRTTAAKSTPKEKGVPAFVEALKQAQEVLLDAHASALINGNNAMLHHTSNLLQSTVISLTAASSPKMKTTIQSESTTVAVELARNAAWEREQQAILSSNNGAESSVSMPQDASSADLSDRMAKLGLASDMTRFQSDFIELVPKTWSVISLSLSDNQHDLCITKFQSGHSPFILRLPLERANSRDADSEIFNFQHGHEEMLDIIKNANRTSHSGGSLTTKASRNAWWAERESLDNRLKELLAVMETTWLGGFKGIFSQHERRPDLLARFQKSFHQVLDRSLPSRSGGGRGKKTPKRPGITLDPRILDLFIGLGDPTDPDSDFDEALNDLLYFVVDVLQFHGERNAYDEIDFDAMVVETYDALRGYYAAAKAEGPEVGAHTILVLDKALHAFPWESMPCMEGLAVSRVPSLAHLRRLITEAKAPAAGMANGFDGPEDMPGGHYVSAQNGTYMLNPSSDLKNTQSYFHPTFSSLKNWTGLVNKTPQEHEFENALSTSDVLLYFGHGGGAQYIRGKTIRRLEKCKPATFLMGCSSASLTEAGEFECYGPVWNYLTAGCPAVVGTLWDVTDRDIDRFAGRAFEEWGLFPRDTFKEDKKEKGRQLQEMDVDMEGHHMMNSLSEAVARAREACRFRYLNAAAVVMYGIPVYIEKEL